jgi:hypothetical protein
MHPLLEELAAGVGSVVLSEIQFHAAMACASNWTASTYIRLIAHHNLSGPNARTQAFVRTVCGRFRARGMPGGRDPSLGLLDLVARRWKEIAARIWGEVARETIQNQRGESNSNCARYQGAEITSCCDFYCDQTWQ